MSVDAKTLAVYNAKAADYSARFDSAGKPGAQLKRFMAAVPAGGSVLDWGCGPGGAAAHMVAAGLGVDAVDASEEMVRLACAAGVPARLGTFDDLEAQAVYDGVWANFSLLHAPREDLPRLLGAVARSLRPSGVFHIALKTGEGTHRDGIDRLYTFLSEDELAGLLTDAGFEIVATDTGCEAGLAGTKDPWIAHLTRKI